ncbi:glycosyltransferase [Pseudoxanthomonas sp. NC8]|nr:glycosyltransferase [Pseudoxanthomonas sp. NC8]
MTTIGKIAILLPDLRPGGAEKMHTLMASEWMARGFDVEFVLQREEGELIALLPEGAGVVGLDADRARRMLWPLARYLRKAHPDVLLAAMWPLTVIAPLAARLAGFRGRVIVSEHTTWSAAHLGPTLAHPHGDQILHALVAAPGRCGGRGIQGSFLRPGTLCFLGSGECQDHLQPGSAWAGRDAVATHR